MAENKHKVERSHVTTHTRFMAIGMVDDEAILLCLMMPLFKLVGGFKPFEKYDIVKMGSSSPNKGENKKYLHCQNLD